MKVYLKGGTVIVLNIDKHPVLIDSKKLGYFTVSDDPWKKETCDDFMISLDYVEKIEL